MAKNLDKKMSSAVRHRFPAYYQHIQRLLSDGYKWTSSKEIGNALGFTSSTVRQDLSHLDSNGIANKGYELKSLKLSLQKIMKIEQAVNIIILGIDNQAKSIALNNHIFEYGFNLCAIFDTDPKIIGNQINGVIVLNITNLEEYVNQFSQKISIAILTFPPEIAQNAIERLIQLNIPGILNLTNNSLIRDDRIKIIDIPLITYLLELNSQLDH